MLNYLVVMPKGEVSVLQIVPEGVNMHGDFESWALRRGDQLLFVNHRMHRLLRDFHMLGNYQSGAMYGYSFDDMCAIVTSKLGPSDRERVMELQEGVDFVYEDRLDGRWEVAAVFAIEVGKFLIKALYGAAKFLGWMILIPLLIRLFSKRK